MRFFVDLSYNGANYHGWQIQPNAVTVQEVFNKALSTLLKDDINCTGAGRTDTGVHALQMFAHFDTETPFDLEKIKYRLNAFLPNDIAIREVFKVNPNAHTRFDALQRTYLYKISRKKEPFYCDQSFQYTLPLDVGLMNQACEILKSYDDFECFSRAHSDVKTFLCDIKQAQWYQNADLLEFEISANRFLRNMVRAIVGTMIDVGAQKTSLEEFHNIIKSKDRSKAGASAPAKGLFLTEIQYPNSIYNNE